MTASDPLTTEALLAHVAWVQALAQNLVSDRDRADELGQRAWLATLEASRKGRLRLEASRAPDERLPLAGWFARVLRNFALSTRRTAGRVRAREERAARPEAQPSTTEVCERAELHRVLVEHVLALEEPYRSTLLLRYFQGLSPTAIAERERTPVRTINTRIARGHRLLRERLERSGQRDRTDWLSGLILLADDSSSGTSTLVGGALLMSSKQKIAIAVVLVLALVGGITAVMSIERESGRPLQDPVAVAFPSAERAPSSTPTESERAAAAGVPSPAASPATDPASELRGRVIDSDGAGIAAATVSAWRDVAREFPLFRADTTPAAREVERTLTDSDGNFVLPLPAGRPFDVRAQAPGRPTACVRDRYAGETLTIVLTRGASLGGTIRLGPELGVVAQARIVLSDDVATTFWGMVGA
jgi:RNA polymerase sigma factor (sigma-70 family)